VKTDRRAFAAALGWAALIFFASVMPTPPAPAPDWPLDKVFHALVYLPLGALLFLAIGPGMHSVFQRALVSALATGGFGLALEVVQYCLPWRSFEWADAGVDLLGGVVGAAGAGYWWRARGLFAKSIPKTLKPGSGP